MGRCFRICMPQSFAHRVSGRAIKEKYSVNLNPQQIAQVKTGPPKKKGKSKAKQAKQAKSSDYSDGGGDFPKPTPKGNDPNIRERLTEVLADLHTVRQIADRI